MTVAVQDLGQRPSGLSSAPRARRRPARRAVVRWSWRLFRREWRQQLLVLALMIVAVATTVAGVAVATTTAEPGSTTLTILRPDPQLAADVATLRKAFGAVDVISHERVPVPGSVSTVDVRAFDSLAGAPHHTLRLLDGRYPGAPGEVALTDRVAATFDLGLGDTWHEDGQNWRVVGLVENPTDLLDEFALLAPGQIGSPSTVTIVLPKALSGSFHPPELPGHPPIGVEIRSATARDAAAAVVLALATIGLLFVALVASAGFAVMAQRRLRALGMLASQGATDRHVRLVMLASGAVVGIVAAVVGLAAGLGGWLLFAPHLERIAERRIDRFDLPWWAVALALILAVVTAIGAAWWPARSVARVPIVAALSGRPPRPLPAHRSTASGGVLILAGLVLLAMAHPNRALPIIGGAVATTLGLLLLAPLAIRGLAAAGRGAPVAVRMALRDLGRYQARSAGAVGAITLAAGIAATIVIGTSAVKTTSDAGAMSNLPRNELVAYLGGSDGQGPVPQASTTQLQAAGTAVNEIAKAIGSKTIVPLEQAIDPNTPPADFGGQQPGKDATGLAQVTRVGKGERISVLAPLFVATPAVLAHFGIDPARIDPSADVLSSRTDLAGLVLFDGERDTVRPKIQRVDLPRYGSDPNSLITPHAMQALGLQAVPSAWLLQTAKPLTSAQINAARKAAAAGGLDIETHSLQQSNEQLRVDATIFGILLALGVLAMTVGLIRSETAGDLRTLTATGAASRTRRTLTATTAGALALLGAVLGCAGAYAAVIVWNRNSLHSLTHVPVGYLTVIVLGLPLVAVAGGWLLAGREPRNLGARPVD